MSRLEDLILSYKFLKKLTTPFVETTAFKLGIIDKDGKVIKSPQTSQEKDALGNFDKIVFNIKKIIERMPGGKSKLASYASSLYLLREDKEMMNIIKEEVANQTGSAVAGTGQDVASWKDGRKKDTKEFLRRYLEDRKKREECQKIKEKEDFLKRLGVVKEIQV